MIHLSCFTYSHACIYRLSISHSYEQTMLSEWYMANISQQNSAQSSPGWSQIQFCCWVCEEENHSQSICWLGFSVWFAPCTGKAGSIDFIRHRSVGLSVCLSCIPDIPEPLPALCFLCLAGHHTTVSPKKKQLLPQWVVLSLPALSLYMMPYSSTLTTFPFLQPVSRYYMMDIIWLLKPDSDHLSWHWTVMT